MKKEEYLRPTIEQVLLCGIDVIKTSDKEGKEKVESGTIGSGDKETGSLW